MILWKGAGYTSQLAVPFARWLSEQKLMAERNRTEKQSLEFYT